MAIKKKYRVQLGRENHPLRDLTTDELRAAWTKYYELEQEMIDMLSSANTLWMCKENPIPLNSQVADNEIKKAPRYIRAICQFYVRDDQDQFVKLKNEVDDAYIYAKNEVDFTGFSGRHAEIIDDVTLITLSKKEAFRSNRMPRNSEIVLQTVYATKADPTAALDAYCDMKELESEWSALGYKVAVEGDENVTQMLLDTESVHIVHDAARIQMRELSGLAYKARLINEHSTMRAEERAFSILVVDTDCVVSVEMARCFGRQANSYKNNSDHFCLPIGIAKFTCIKYGSYEPVEDKE